MLFRSLDAVATLATAGALAPGRLTIATLWPLLALPISVVVSTLVGQSALAAGRLPWVLACVAVVNPLGSLTICAIASTAPVVGGRLPAVGLAAACMVAGALAVARGTPISPRPAPAGWRRRG